VTKDFQPPIEVSVDISVKMKDGLARCTTRFGKQYHYWNGHIFDLLQAAPRARWLIARFDNFVFGFDIFHSS